MASSKEPIGEMILKQIFDPAEMMSKNPTVLSCGGIFIPRRGDEGRAPYHVITTSSLDEPVKLVSGTRPRNSLYEVLLKESMN